LSKGSSRRYLERVDEQARNHKREIPAPHPLARSHVVLGNVIGKQSFFAIRSQVQLRFGHMSGE
jgi:hypothetical protein